MGFWPQAYILRKGVLKMEETTRVQELHAKFDIYYPFISEKVTEYREYSNTELLVKLDDGRSVIYDDFDGTIRYLITDEDVTEEQFKKEVSVRISRLLLKKGMTQCDLAEASGLSQSTISSYITRRQVPSAYNLYKIARALECSVEDLQYNV